MTLGKFWKRKHGLALVQMRQLEVERATERVMGIMERDLFANPLPVALLSDWQKRWDGYTKEIENQIISGWQPSESAWDSIRQMLYALAQERDRIQYGEHYAEIKIVASELARQWNVKAQAEAKLKAFRTLGYSINLMRYT